jgi:hypothetical protein
MATGDVLQIAGDNATAISVTVDSLSDGGWSAPTPNNLLVAFVGGDEPISSFAGWTKRDDAGGSPQLEVWDRISDGSESSITATGAASGDLSMHIFEIEGKPTYDVGVTNRVSSDTSIASGSTPTLSLSDSIALVSCFHFAADDTSFDSGYSTDLDYASGSNGSSYYQGTGHKDLTTTAATSTTATYTTLGDSSIIIAVYSLSLTASAFGVMNGGGSITATATKRERQELRPISTPDAGDWDTGPTTGQSLDGYTSDESDATYIEDAAI